MLKRNRQHGERKTEAKAMERTEQLQQSTRANVAPLSVPPVVPENKTAPRSVAEVRDAFAEGVAHAILTAGLPSLAYSRERLRHELAEIDTHAPAVLRCPGCGCGSVGLCDVCGEDADSLDEECRPLSPEECRLEAALRFGAALGLRVSQTFAALREVDRLAAEGIQGAEYTRQC
jgi:hypothetical protein